MPVALFNMRGEKIIYENAFYPYCHSYFFYDYILPLVRIITTSIFTQKPSNFTHDTEFVNNL